MISLVKKKKYFPYNFYLLKVRRRAEVFTVPLWHYKHGLLKYFYLKNFLRNGKGKFN